ncbi:MULTISPECIES: iron uptake porin [unclassified Microcoleus]|uniref:iron uptake porin n=1 Tax=unclassified Microcoleus TaxID=2642155 RepID=UPI002FCF8791
MKNHKCDRQIWKILSSLIVGFGLQALFSISALAETTDPETTANSANSEDPVNEWYQLPAPTNNLPDNFDRNPDRKLVENAHNVDVTSPINPTSEPPLPMASEIETHISEASETQPAEIPPLIEENKLANPPLIYPTENSIEQVTSVSQLSDVQPTDWAFQALQSLVERYGCIAGYPDGTYRGNRALTRYEFAAGVNACLDKIRESIAKQTQNQVNRNDLIKVQKLQEEFAAEIATLRGRTDLLEARATELEANQFSTTTKLSGFTVFGIQGRTPNRADRAPRDGKRDTKDPGTNVNIINLNQFYLTTQFSPRSNLLIGFYNQNGGTSPQLTEDVNLAYNLAETSGLTLSDLNYRFLVGDKLAVFAGTAGVNLVTGFRGPNRAESAASGPLSAFAQRNPILNTGLGLGGIGIDWQFANRASLQAVYSTNIPGFFVSSNGSKGHNTLGVQLTLTPADPVDVTVYYVNDYSPNGNLINLAGDGQLTAINPSTNKSASLQTNAVGASLNWRLSSRVSVGGWAGYTNSRIPGKSGTVATTNYMVFVNFPDLFKSGSLGGIYIGQPPKIVSSNLPTGNNVPDFLDTGLGRSGGQPGTTTHVEVFYRWQVNDNISVTPGLILIFQPGHTPDSDPISVGVLRTSFSF